MNSSKFYLAVASLTVFATVTLAVPAAAQEPSANETVAAQSSTGEVTIPTKGITRGEAGKEYVRASKEGVANGEYTVKVVTTNQGSVHPNSDVIVRSGTSSVTVSDVEAAKHETKTGHGTLTVEDGKVSVLVELGEDKVFSGKVNVVLTPVVKPVEEPKQEKETPKKEEAPAPSEEAPATLPEVGTGVASVGLLASVTTAVGYAAHMAYRRFRG